MKNLLPAIAGRGVNVDLLHVRDHGPYLEARGNLEVIKLGTRHAYSSLLPLTRYLRERQPDALLSDKDRVNRVAILAGAMSGAPTRIIVRTGTTVSMDLRSRRPLDRFLTWSSMRYLYRRADTIILPSGAAAEDFLKVTKLHPAKVIAIPSPIATPDLYNQAAEPVEDPWLSEKAVPIIVGIGELSGRKDFDTLVRAFAEVRKTRGARLVIYGEGRRRPSLEALVKEMGLSEDVQLPGFCENPYPALARADLYVHSSRQEGAPVALMEAIALGVPSVSTDCPSGPAEILQGGKYGRLVAVGDVGAMAHAMLDYLETPPDRQQVKRASRPFSLEESTSAYMKALGFIEGGY
jgi:glycosyltransferase involved in cell wall biosynthesis